MRKSHLFISACCLTAATAWAQEGASTVSLYGMVDVNLQKINNGAAGSSIQESGGTLNASRIGFRGREELGGGLAAGFWLESGLNADTGANTSAAAFFNRGSTVSLYGKFGEVRLGHDNVPTYFNMLYYDPFLGGGTGSFINMFISGGSSTPLLSGATTISRSNNGIGYFLPKDLGGIFGQAQYSLGEGVNGARHTGARLGYKEGPVDIGVAYSNTGVVQGKAYRFASVGGTYRVGPVKLVSQYVATKTGVVGNYVTNAGNQSLLVGATTYVGPHEYRIAYTAQKGNGFLSAQKANLFALGYVYSLSKRTAVYTAYGIIRNQGGTAYTVSPAPTVTQNTVSAAGAMGSSTIMSPGSSSSRSSGLEFGIRHMF